jgi:hypothetical protein
LKASAKYYDRSSIHPKRDAAITFTAEFAVGFIDLGVGKGIEHIAENAAKHAVGNKVAKLGVERGTELGLGILWSSTKGVTLEPAKSVLEGDTLQKSMLSGALKGAGGVHGELFKYFLLNRKMRTAAIVVDTAVDISMEALAGELSEPHGERKDELPKLHRPSTPRNAMNAAAIYDSKAIEEMAVKQIGSANYRVLPASRRH